MMLFFTLVFEGENVSYDLKIIKIRLEVAICFFFFDIVFLIVVFSHEICGVFHGDILELQLLLVIR